MIDVDGGGAGRVPKPLAWALLAALVAPLLMAAAAVVLGDDGAKPVGEPGALTEPARRWRPVDGSLPKLTDITAAGAFSTWRHTGESPTSGGAAIADVDGDGAADVVVGGGSGGVFFGGADNRWAFVELVADDRAVTSVATGDVDGDGQEDVLFGTTDDADLIVWGGAWTRRRAPGEAERTELPSGQPTTGLLVADLDGDGARDVLRLGYGPRREATADVVWAQTAPRTFDRVDLPHSRRSLSAEVTDVNDDGRVEIWVTRDVGWASGADSVYALDPDTGEWVDRAGALGADRAIDGMGVTVADLTGDGRLDTYLSDLGDNELLESMPSGSYRAGGDVGLARIRPPGADRSVISSSWASAAVDLNLDGRLDVVVANGGFGADADVVNKIDGTTIADDDPPAILLARSDSTYADVWSDLGLTWAGRGRGMSAGDIDGDGDTDLVLVIHGHGLRVLRNDTAGPSLRVRPAPGCDASGAGVTVTSELGTSTALLGPHTFLGAHATELVVGAGGTTEITTRYARAEPDTRRVEGLTGRTEVIVPCR